MTSRWAPGLALAAMLVVAGTIVLAASTAPVRLIGVSRSGGALLIESSEPAGYVVTQPDPLTVIVELRDVDARSAGSDVERRAPISSVSVEAATTGDGKALARVRVTLAEPADYTARSTRNTIRLELTAKTVAAKPAAIALSRSSSMAGESSAATMIHNVQATHVADTTTITLMGNGQLIPSNVSELPEKPRRLVLDFPHVDANASVRTVSSPLVQQVRVVVNSRNPLLTRVVMAIDEHATYHVERGADATRELAVVFEPALATSAILLTPAEQIPIDPEPAISMPEALANGARLAPPGDAPNPAPAPVRQPAPAKSEARQQSAPTPQQLPTKPPVVTLPAQQPMTAGDRQYVGTPLTLDFAGADLRAVLRAIIAHGGLNVVFDNAVQGSIDIVLNDIPWDQALETILRANKLGYVAEGTIIRIAPISVLAEEEAERRKLAEARALAGDLRVQTFALSYAKATEMQPLLTKSALSARGQIQVDSRTNTLIITDLPDRLQTAANLISGLDRPEPQVEVEARIVQTSRDFARAIGIQWGLNGRMTPEIGNTTGLAFPNRGSVGGRLGSQGASATDTRGNPIDNTGTVVGLPATAIGSAAVNTALGLALGSVNGSFNLDVALTALERSGKGRVLSTPRLTTQNNIAAEVGQGIQIPIQTVANNTVTVTFKEALLKLMVTPQITAAGTVIMQVTIENASADFSRQVNGIPPIDTQRAQTQVQVNDGATTVIGGIFVSREQSSTDRTPMLSRVPLLGWLFRRDSVQDESRELLIFITPRILKG
ncbi:MAG: type IV pilus secretin PilQ [Vicinamibacterales bacterium]